MQPTKKLPLFIVAGASCVGKSALCEALFRREEDYIVLEGDLLWDDRYNTPEDHYSEYRSLWLNLCANVSQIGKPVVLCGCGMPVEFETRPERQLFSEIHYLAVVCGEECLRERMEQGRGVTDPGWIESSLHFNRWLRENAGTTSPPMELIDTTDMTIGEAAEKADRWIRAKMEQDMSH